MKVNERFEQSKAIAGAASGFVADMARHFLAGGELETAINSGERLLELVASMAIGWGIVYFSPRNAPAKSRRKR